MRRCNRRIKVFSLYSLKSCPIWLRTMLQISNLTASSLFCSAAVWLGPVKSSKVSRLVVYSSSFPAISSAGTTKSILPDEMALNGMPSNFGTVPSAPCASVSPPRSFKVLMPSVPSLPPPDKTMPTAFSR